MLCLILCSTFFMLYHQINSFWHACNSAVNDFTAESKDCSADRATKLIIAFIGNVTLNGLL